MCSLDHPHELDLVCRRHDNDVGEGPQVRQVEAAVMGWPVVADETRTVDHEANRERLNDAVVNDLVVPSLEEGGVNGTEGLQAIHCHAGSESHRVLLGDADVERSLGKDLSELVQPRPSRHGRGDAADRRVLSRELDEGVGEDRRVGGRAALGFLLLPGRNVELSHPVHFVRGLEGGQVAVALLSLHVQQHRLLRLRIPQVLKDGDQVLQVVTVDGTQVVEPQLLEQDCPLLP
mmetsp:Transcript_16006/g.53638  ORF Transcript_16006/g.53638 Transcript_16006/m.53638 type:complete len:233 (-) Transcript_16006:939-1637(-)